MKKDKFLLGIIVGIGLLVIAALAVYFTRQTAAPTYRSEETPEGVVYNYILALRKEDYARAYGYLADKTGKPTQTAFRQAVLMNKDQIQQAIVDLGDTNIDADSAIIEVAVQNAGNDGIFGGGYQNKENAILERVDGAWKLTSMPYMFWSYDWYQFVK
jgi:hypothetical protein